MFFLYVTLLAAFVQDGLTLDRAYGEVTAVCGDNSSLKCEAVSKAGVQYHMVRWYKLEEEPSNQESGLLKKRLSPNGTIQRYSGLEREVGLLADDSLALFLPNVTTADSARYKCQLVAPTGELNQEGLVQLTVLGCSDKKTTVQSIDTILILSIVGIVAALLIYCMSYVILRNMLIQRGKRNPNDTLLDANLEKKDLKLIYTMETNASGQHSIKPICV
ncbi:hypothetical protein DPEC_G00352710 [Dallia pectoralis]|uniref:Uncharacterized protein n=1 Tax=Dallia pectoralis TaxID=75939 RepID=A0ACC2F2D7_DALPE|nr:hypothetical protein DPEC_G00352710 [Dallia pectoralis]